MVTEQAVTETAKTTDDVNKLILPIVFDRQPIQHHVAPYCLSGLDIAKVQALFHQHYYDVVIVDSHTLIVQLGIQKVWVTAAIPLAIANGPEASKLTVNDRTDITTLIGALFVLEDRSPVHFQMALEGGLMVIQQPTAGKIHSLVSHAILQPIAQTSNDQSPTFRMLTEVREINDLFRRKPTTDNPAIIPVAVVLPANHARVRWCT